jgi:hypothetical protein
MYNKSLSELFGIKVPHPPEPIDTNGFCPFLQQECKKSSGIDDERLRPSGACSIWFNCNFYSNPIEKPIIICPNRFYLNSYYHLWSLVKRMITCDIEKVHLIPEVMKMDWIIYSEDEDVVGAIEVQSADTTGSYKPQLYFLRNIPDEGSLQYPEKVNANWANFSYKRFYPQVYQTIATMEQFNAPVGLLSQDVFKPYLSKTDRFPKENEENEKPEVIWALLSIDDVVGTTTNLNEEFLYFNRESIKDVILKTPHPSSEEVFRAIIRQMQSGKGIQYQENE